MGVKRLLIYSLLLGSFLQISYGCQIDGFTLGPVPNTATILDTFRGVIRSANTTNVQSITSVNWGGALNAGPYLDIYHEDSVFVIQTSSNFEQYEEHETSSELYVTINLSCTGGSTNVVVFMISITDTNNNAPIFLPTDNYEFVVTPPLPPGFLVTGCFNDITVRDIDLTTTSIIFEIENNPYFEIRYDAESSTEVKEFKAELRTTTFLRTLREPLTLRINATDVDGTNDPPLTTSATVRIIGDTEFEFPEEPVFSQTFYFANYTDDQQLILHETIFLQQGFDEHVDFSLEGEYASYFRLSASGNQVSLVVGNTSLPLDVWAEKQIYLIVRAEREFTSGDTATIVVYLPEETPLMFSSAIYQGTIEDNTLQLSPLALSQGYEDAMISADVIGEYASYFTVIVQGNLVTLTMAQLTDDIIDDNNYISIQIVASTDRTRASTIVSLEIIKEDKVTPVFDKSIYTGTYNPDNGLNVEQILFVQGFDETVSVQLFGEHSNLFQINNGTIITVTSSSIPPELYEEQRIILSLEATKPRTVGANAAIIVALPAVRSLDFEELTYRGIIQDNILTLQTIILLDVYDENIQFDLIGDYATFFNVTNVGNQVTIRLNSLPDSVISQNTAIILTLTASGLNTVRASTSVLLDIIKDDTTTPVFNQNIYYGTYSGPTSLDVESIFLTQGFDSQVYFRLDGAHANYFDISTTGNLVELTLQSTIPDDVIFNEKVLLFNLIADKALSVGANAAVLIKFPPELTESTIMRFSQNSYVGTYENNELTLDNISLDIGYTTGTDFLLTGEYAEYFDLSNANNTVQISSLNPLPTAVIEDDSFIILSIEARRQRAVSTWTTVIIDIVPEDIIKPVFSQAYYRGVYSEENSLQFHETIYLLEGYDGSVSFELDGEYSTWFSLVENGNSVTLVLDSPIPQAVLDNNNQLLFTIVAQKTNAVHGRAVISIDLATGKDLRFSQDYYKGYIDDGILTVENIIIHNLTIPSDVKYNLLGDFSEYFQIINQEGIFILELEQSIPTEILESNNLMILTLEIQYGNKTLTSVIILEIINEQNEVKSFIFEKTFYVGSYNDSDGLVFEEHIRINDEYFAITNFNLEGDDSQWFRLDLAEDSLTLVQSNSIPAEILANNQQLIFVVAAQRPGGSITRATIVISLTEEYTEGLILGFDRVTYLGSIENNQATIPTITLSEGYTQDVTLTLRGELAEFFSVTAQGAVVTVTLDSIIPAQLIPTNRIILLEIQASASTAMPAYATLVIEYVAEDDIASVVEMVFAQVYYTGSYTDDGGLVFTTPISLSEGYNASVEFKLEGDQSVWFDLVRNENSLTLAQTSSIPAGILANNQQLIFVVTAQIPGGSITRATIVISLTEEYTEGLILGFDRVTYLGSIENNQATIPTITLSEGYTQDVTLTLRGELAEFFSVTVQGAVVTVTLDSIIPAQLIPINRIILLEIQASASTAMPAYATLVIEYVAEDDIASVVEMVFAQVYYTGSYTDDGGLVFTTPISLSEGYNASVEFKLEGDQSVWFDLVRNENSLTLAQTSSIPAGILANNQQLIFVVTAQIPGGSITRATIVISLTEEYTEGLILGFDRVTYLGSIENNQATIPTITLSEGYTQDVTLTLRGELAEFFSVTAQGAVVTVTLDSIIPAQLIPTNRIILLEIQASASTAMPAYATLVIEYVAEDDIASVVEMVFAQVYYTGSYTDDGGLVFTTPISLSEGYNASVEFKLEGDQSVWFDLVRNENSLTLAQTSSIPAGILANNQQLIFVVTAQIPGGSITRATIVISLTEEYTEGLILGFDRVTYLGSIENNQATIPTITLSEGYTQDVTLTLRGELAEFFSVTVQGAVVTVTLDSIIPAQLIPTNRIILLEIQASASTAMPAYATLVIEYVAEDDIASVVEMVFAQVYYTGSYTDDGGLVFTTPISLSEGYNASVEFKLEGDQSVWFDLVRNENSLTLAQTSSIPAGILANNQQLIFVVTAQIPGGSITRATIVISLTEEYTEGLILGFDRVTYLGSIENNQATIPTITLSEGYTQDVTLTLRGELAEFFSVTAQGAVVTVTLDSIIPAQLIPTNRIILLEIQASASTAMPAYATLVIEYVAEDDIASVVEMVFAQVYYTGSYTDDGGLVFTTPISLSEGYNASVEFKLEGDQSGWFDLVRNENSLTLVQTSSIPAGILANNQQLIFVVTAQIPGGSITRATIVISLTEEYTEGLILGFDRVTYLGSIENNQATIPTITLSEGYTQDVTLTLRGELAEFFSVTAQGAVVTVTLDSIIPAQLIPTNRIILLEIQASASTAMPAYATLVIEYVAEDDIASVVEMVFAQVYYTGSYTDDGGLVFTTPISLSEGYNASVEFKLEGDQSVWFDLVRNENSLTLVQTSSIPAGILANNQQLIFVVTAQIPGGSITRATIVISLTEEYTEGLILGFDRVTYLGSIENNQATIPTITLSEGYTQDVTLTLRGELAEFFSVTAQGAVVTVTLDSIIPAQLIPTNRIILLEIQASASTAMPAYATLVIEYVAEDDIASVVEMVFAQVYYTGSYTDDGGLVFTTPISLSEGYNASVEFKLEGDQSGWFDLVRNENSLTLVQTSSIPAGILANNQQLIFVVTAQIPGGSITRATIVISLTEEYTEGLILGFDRVTYLGSIENNQATIPTITLSEGYTQDVTLTLRGELAEFFSVTAQGAVVTVTLDSIIPAQLIPTNRIILLEIQASASTAMPAYATLVIEYVAEDDIASVVEMVFAQVYYTGSYTDDGGLVFTTPISLSEGYNASVEFKLEGDQSVWFDLVRNENSLTLVQTSSIPAGILANNQQLIFVVTAQIPGGSITRATIVISLTEEYTEGLILGFDRVTYLGSIENNQATIPTITLSEGYTQDVTLTLRGELAEFFSVTAQGAVVTVTLDSIIPAQLIPTNRIILLEIQASASTAMPAYATLVIEYVAEDDIASVVEMVFAQVYYTGSYTDDGGLVFTTPISLSEGYNASVEFKLEGDQSVWFDLVRNENSLTLVQTSSIPAGILANNQQLIFVVTAQIPGGSITRATIVISLTEEYTEGLILGFDRVTYLGSIENNQATIPTITLSEGYTQDVTLTLRGELAEFFSVTAQGAVVTVTLDSIIPAQLIPTNRIILLEIQASASTAMPAYATLVIEYVAEDDIASVVEMVFAQVYYTGSYTDDGGLVFTTPISLSEGYNASVEFELEGDQSVWFDLVRNENSLTLVQTSSIPAGILANNQQLIFVVTAQIPGGSITRATIVISLTEEYTEGLILGFDRVTYLGSIENNQATIPTITLSEGYTQDVTLTLRGELAEFFSVTAQGAVVTVTLDSIIPAQLIPTNRIILLEIQASASTAMPAYATLVIEYVAEDDIAYVVEMVFAQDYYTGTYTDDGGLVFTTPISLSEGYNASVEFKLEGDQSIWFDLVRNENSLTLVQTSSIPDGILANYQQLIFVVTAQRPGGSITRATIVISLTEGPQTEASFGKVLFEGIIQNNVVIHETITITAFNGTNIELYGEYSPLFEADLSNGVVTVRPTGSLTLPANVTHITLELGAGTARAILLLNVEENDASTLPVVTFGSASYAVRVEITDKGFVGQVQASADNGETVQYSLEVDYAHLQERLSINDAGELHLSAPVNSGVYMFQVVATTIFTRQIATATVHLSVEAITVCGDDLVMPPLIVLDRDEEEPHSSLINKPNDGCHFTLSNRWPLNQTWLYVDDMGLHTTAIDREHESIAFMPVSQVQVEVILQCETDVSRVRRSTDSRSLGPYDYGNNKWILTDTILYNSRRSLVNLIVNDINDNAPVFVEKEQEPIAVGYPVAELAERVLPRSLTVLQATDADIGENAALLYWSSEPELAVAPATGFVHIKDGASVENDARLTVHATDRNGQGLTGSIDIVVRLLDESNIVVVTVRDAFLDDESDVISRLSESVGYEVKVLRSVVISDEEDVATRKIREVTSAGGASLQLYVYGLIEREPVSIGQLTTDISNAIIAQVNIASTVSLEDHLAGQEICVIPGRDAGLLAATIVLSVLLFIIIVLIAVWLFLRWRKNQNYDQFSDENSLASRNESVDQFPKPIEVMTKPRLNIEELKKSERRLQEMLDAPVSEIPGEPSTSRKDAVIDMSPSLDLNARTVIQSIDKLKDAVDDSSDDEFGERSRPKRKSVVTFNENVEKIIHVEDTDVENLSKAPGYEVYKL